MSTPLLTTKLYIPPVRPRESVVPRPRLIEQLNEGPRSGRKLTLISAPAGFGKTTLLSEWIAQDQSPIPNPQFPKFAWLSLDESDNDPTGFLTYFIAALSRVEGVAATIGKGALSMLHASQAQPPPTEAVLTALINEVAAIPDRIVLVLDDYHLIEAQSIHDALTFLLRRLPPQMHLVMATREDPHLPLARLRARGQLTELRATDLRFSSSEAAEFLNQVMGLNLAAEDIAALETRTEGWIAGLQLAAISMQGHKDATSLIKSFTGSHRYVLDYLIEEVLEQQSESVQTFLLQTAVLDRLTGSLCDAVRFGVSKSPTGQDNGQATLETLERANLFIVPLDEERRWYRYHHLFSDLLRQRLRQNPPPLSSPPLGKVLTDVCQEGTEGGIVAELHIRASQWFEQNGFIDEAIEHALRAKDFERVASLIERVAETTWGRDEHTKLGRWLAGLPAEWVFTKPQLCIFHAGYLFASGQQAAAERCLQAAEQALDPNSDGATKSVGVKQGQPAGTDRIKLLGRIAATRSFMASYRSDAPGVIPHARQALEYLPEQDVTWRGAAAIALGDAYIYQGQYVAAQRTYLEALEAIKATGNTYLFLNVSLKLALNLRSQGRLQQVSEICQQRLQLASESGMSQTEMVGWLLAIWGEVLAEINDLDGAIELVRKGVELTERGGDVAMLTWSYLCLTRVLFSRGDMAGAQEIITETENIARASIVPHWITNLMAAWQVRVWLAQDRPDETLQWVQKRGLDPDTPPTYVGALEYIALARILIAQERYDDADRLLQRLLEPADAGAHNTRVIEILMLQALAFQAGGDTVRAMTTLERALTLAEPGGFIRIFVDEGPPMARLLYAAVTRGIAPDYARRLLAAFPAAEPEQTGPSVTEAPESEMVEPLSEREIEVLQLIAAGLTNREIASRLFLSLNTIKVHTRNIYGKLGVHNRTEAVARARTLGILPSTLVGSSS